MGFGFAGAAAGLGEGLVSWADERQKLADDLLKQKQRTEQVAALRQQERSWDLQDRAHKEGREDASRKRAANVYESLFGTESGGNFDAMNGEGYGGRGQFGQDRLDDWSKATGAPRISVEEFRKNKDLQKDIEKWHFGDVKDFIQSNDLITKYDGQTVGGVKITESGMIAAAHLGGKNGLKKFLESDGKYDPADSNGTSISDYMRTHGNLSTNMDGVWDVLADPNVPAGMKERVADRVTGADKTPSLTGGNWVDQGDGTEVLMGREGKSNRMAPYQGPDGKPVKRKIDDKKDQGMVGQSWVRQKDGTEVLMGRVSKTGKMAPYTDDSGKPITRAPKPEKPESIVGETWVPNGDNTETLMGRSSGSDQMVPYRGPDGQPITRRKEQAGFSQGGELTRSDRLDLRSMYDSAFDEYYGAEKPTEAQFIAYVQSSRRDGEDLAAAADRAAREWTEETVVEKVEKPRNALGRLVHGTDTKTVDVPRTVSGFGGATAQPAAPGPDGSPQVEQILQEARDAIARGASREAVIARLREQGIDPKGL